MRIEIEPGKNNSSDERSFEAFADDGMLSGAVVYARVSDERCELKRIFVEPMYRGEGIAKKLMKTALQSARDEWYKEMTAYTERSMYDVNLLLQSYGFVEIAPGPSEASGNKNLLLLKL